MLKFLLAVDGSEISNKAVFNFIKLLDWYKEIPEIHLLNVQYPLHGNAPILIDKSSINEYHQEKGMKELQASCKIMDKAGVPYHFHITVGDPAEMILRYGTEKQCDQIIIGPRKLGAVKGLLLGSVTSKVMQLSKIPVLLIKS
jgi:nucleotide-binding universal stress UspA family protein